MALPSDTTAHDDNLDFDLHRWQSKVLSIILIVAAVTGLPAYATVIINAIHNGQMTLQVWLYLVIYLASVGLALFPKLDFRVRSIGLFMLTYTNAVVSFARLGLAGSGRLWLVVMPIIATIVIGSWAGYVTLALGLLIYATFAILAHLGVLGGWINLPVNPLTLDYWIEGGAALVIFLVAIVILVDRFYALYARILVASRRANADLKQLAGSLRESEERYRTLVGASPDGIVQTDLDGRILFASPQLMRLFGLTDSSEIVNTSVLEWIAPEDRERARDNVRRAVQGLATPNNPYIFLRSDGAPFSVEVNSAPWRDATGQTRGMISIVRDVTERVQTQAELREKTLELERFFDCALDLLCIADTDGYFQRLNREWEKVLGYPLEELEGRRFLDLVHPADLASTLAAVSDLDAQREVLNFVNRYRCQDGSYRWIEWRAFPFGKKIYAAARDITERKRVEAELRTSEARYRALVQSQIDLISRYLPDTTLTFVNDAYCQFYGKTPEELIGRSYLTMVAPEFHAQTWREAENFLKDPRPIGGEYLNYRWDGQECWIHWIVQGIVDDNGRVVEIQASGRDITPLKQAEEEIRRLNEELEQRVIERTAQLEAANKELEAFSYSISHDLRAPLRAIDGYTRILVEDYEPVLDAEGRRVCSVIHHQTQRMGELIDDLLAFSRLSRVDMQTSLIDMEALANSVFQEVTTPQERTRLDFKMLPLPPALGDPTLIRQVWVNLLANAVKFSANRERAVIQVGSSQEAGENIYFVRDNGAGFDMQYAGKLFGVFQRLHSEREFEGTGVGLAIVQRIIRRHGGQVWAEGVVDQGATFYFTLPRKENR